MSYAKGDRVELVNVNDPYTLLPPGTKGTVSSVDSLGTIHVAWDNGSTLGIVMEAGDRIRPMPS